MARGGGYTNKVVGYADKSVGSTNKGVGHTKKSVGHTNKSVGHANKSVGHTNESVGHTDKSVGHPTQSVGHPTERLKAKQRQQLETPRLSGGHAPWVLDTPVSGDTTPSRMTGVTSQSHVPNTEI